MTTMKEKDHKWAPWYVYLVVIVVSNQAKQKLVEDLPVAANVAITVVLVAGLFFVVTAIYRMVRSTGRRT